MVIALLAIEAAAILVLAVLVAALLRSHAVILERLGAQRADAGPGWPREERRVAERRAPAPASVVPHGADGPTPAGFSPIPTGRLGRVAPLALLGRAPAGEAIEVPVDLGRPWTLVFFLASDCLGCRALWSGLGDPRANGLPDHVQPVVVTRGPSAEQAADVLALAGPALDAGVPVVMADEPWVAMEISGASTVVLVDAATGRVVGESAAGGWTHVTDLVAHAVPLPGRAGSLPN